MATMAAAVPCFGALNKAGGGLHEYSFYPDRLSSCPGRIPMMNHSLSSSVVGNDSLRRQWPPSAMRVRKGRLVTTCALNTGDTAGEGSDGPFRFGTTRLKRIIQSSTNNFVSRLKRSRKNFPTKIFLLLLGYYSANALATILGQTGDWDVLAAGLLVAIIEGIGYFMYRMPPFLGEKGKELIVFLNYYKSGFSFGLFVDAFKLGS